MTTGSHGCSGIESYVKNVKEKYINVPPPTLRQHRKYIALQTQQGLGFARDRLFLSQKSHTIVEQSRAVAALMLLSPGWLVSITA